MAESIGPQQRKTYYLSEEERILQPDGPALVGPDGERLELPIKAYEALHHVAQALYQSMGVTVDPRNKVLSFAEAGDVVQLPLETLRRLLPRGEAALPRHRRGARHIAHRPLGVSTVVSASTSRVARPDVAGGP